jgi:hypothetical protein
VCCTAVWNRKRVGMGLDCPEEAGIDCTEVLERDCALACSGCVIGEVVVCDFVVKLNFVF